MVRTVTRRPRQPLAAPRDLHTYVWKKLVGTHAAREASQIEKHDRRGRLNERLATIQQDIYAKKNGVDPPAHVEGKPVRVGDDVNYYDAEPSPWTKRLTAATVALAVLAGILGGKMVSDGQRPPDKDTDTKYTLGGDFEPVPGE